MPLRQAGSYGHAATCSLPRTLGNNNSQTGLGCEFWITWATVYNWETDNSWQLMQATLSTWDHEICANALDHLRFVPLKMSNKHHTGTFWRWLVNEGRLMARHVAPILRAAGPGVRRVAEHFLGKELTSDGVKLLRDGYKVGDAIIGRLQQQS